MISQLPSVRAMSGLMTRVSPELLWIEAITWVVSVSYTATPSSPTVSVLRITVTRSQKSGSVRSSMTEMFAISGLRGERRQGGETLLQPLLLELPPAHLDRVVGPPHPLGADVQRGLQRAELPQILVVLRQPLLAVVGQSRHGGLLKGSGERRRPSWW